MSIGPRSRYRYQNVDNETKNMVHYSSKFVTMSCDYDKGWQLLAPIMNFMQLLINHANVWVSEILFNGTSTAKGY